MLPVLECISAQLSSRHYSKGERQGEFLKEPDNRIIFTQAVTVLSHWNTSLLVLLLQPALTLKGTLLLVLTSLTNVRALP